ncbi:MAG TPA: hypothetical protein VL068_12310 [Microthrixaceae bacterium]|nr:hypothetical protein [Microthrixaceae bacterium]
MTTPSTTPHSELPAPEEVRSAGRHSGVAISDSSAGGREGHSIASGIRSFFLIWYAMLAGIFLWAIHLVALVSLVQLACNDPGTDWITHGVTAVTFTLTAVAIYLSIQLLRTGQKLEASTPMEADPSEADSDSAPFGRLIFMGRFGILIGSISALLILMEEVYAVALHSTTCV